MRRLFWLFVGVGAGAAGAVMTARFARRQVDKVAPANIAREARGSLLEFSKLVSESIAEGKKAMQERQDELRSTPPDIR
ncbi:MAG TPA: hypothetical protein VF984_15320 [Actinomycetota bacterium]